MIYAIGVDGDFTFHEFLRACSRQGVNVQPVNLRAIILKGDWVIETTKSTGCVFMIGKKTITIDSTKGIFFRPFSPSIVDIGQDVFLCWENLIQGIASWILFNRIRVVNSPRSYDFNAVKTVHEHLLTKLGFRVPKSITTSDTTRLVDFAKKNRSIIQAHCGVRANARLVEPRELEKYDPQRGPLHLQEYIPGLDVRTHVVKNLALSVGISSAVVDYRTNQDATAYSFFDFGGNYNDKLISATRHFNLILAGWDFKVDSKGNIWTLEMNSMPGYAGYDQVLGGRIAAEIINYLAADHQGSQRWG